jgi:hypothetical protein
MPEKFTDIMPPDWMLRVTVPKQGRTVVHCGAPNNPNARITIGWLFLYQLGRFRRDGPTEEEVAALDSDPRFSLTTNPESRTVEVEWMLEN